MVVAGEDAPPEAAFKNVPRRRRSAARTPKEEELVGDVDPGRGGSSAPPSRDDEGPTVAPPAASDKKRPSSDRGGGETDVRQAEKRHRPLRAEDTKDGGGGVAHQTFSGGAPPAPSRGTDVVSSSREQPAGWADKEQIRMGKMPASPPRLTAYDDDEEEEDASDARRPPGPGGGKLMGDAIRSHGPPSKNKPPQRPNPKKRKDHGTPFWYGMERDGQSTSAAGSDAEHSFFKMGAVVSDRLRATLASLGVDAAAAPERVYGRLLSSCDRNMHQSRLQMSCKSWRADRGEYPLCAFLTEAENEEVHGEGLRLKAYDRHGKKYEITIRYLKSNRSYRLTNNWGHFLKDNGLVVVKGKAGPGAKHVMLDLWLFRPPGGEVGMVIMHYFKGDAVHADAALDEEEDRRARRRGNDDSMAAKASSLLKPDKGAAGSGNDAAMEEDIADGANGKGGDGGGGLKSESASAPSPSQEPDDSDGVAKAAAGEEQAGPLSSPDADGTKMEEEEARCALEETAAQLSPVASGAPKVEAGGAPGEADGTKTAEKEASAGTTEAAAGQSSASGARGAAKAVGKETGAQGGEDAVQAPSPPDDGAGGGSRKATLTKWELSAAYALVMLSQGIWS